MISDRVKRLFGVGTSIKPITHEDVEAAKPDPQLEKETEIAKSRLYNELVKLEQYSVAVRKLLASDTLDLVARSGKRR